MSDEKPIFEKVIPEWVYWLAQDADGTWWGYEVEPHQHHQGWSLSPIPGLRDTCTSMCNGMKTNSGVIINSGKTAPMPTGKIP